MQINEANLRELFKGFQTAYLQEYQSGTPQWQQIAMRVPSMSKEEVIHWLGAIPGMRELVGEVVIKNLVSHEYTIPNKEWEDTIGVKQFDIETDRYGIYTPLFAEMGRVARQHPDDLLAQLLVAGFSTKCYTGKNFFDANHEPQKGKVKFSNTTNKKYSTANFSVARTNIRARRNAQGRAMGLGRKLLLVICPSDEDAARETLVADKAANGATNIYKGAADIMVMPELESYTAQDTDKPWFLLETGLAVRPLIVQVNKEPVLASLTNPNSDHVFKKHEFLYQAYGRYNVGYGLPELAYGSSGTAAA
jgi:phage major head subunit gpT-like protein